MDTLDCPDASLLSPRRNTTLTALQALSLLNNPFMTRGAERLAERVEADHPHDVPSQLTNAFQLATARPPTADELTTLTNYATRHGLPNACRVILNSNEFVFVE